MTQPSKKSVKYAGFSLGRSLVRFSLYFLLVLIVGTSIYYWINGNRYLYWSIFCGFLCFISGVLSLTITWLWRRKYGIGLNDTLIGAFARTGIPLTGALVIFALLDNNILNKAILSLAGYYLALFPFEVMMSIPREKTGPARQDKTNPQDKAP